MLQRPTPVESSRFVTGFYSKPTAHARQCASAKLVEGPLIPQEIKNVVRASDKPARRKRPWAWIAVTLITIVAILGIIAEVMVRRAGPILKRRIIETLSDRFGTGAGPNWIPWTYGS